MRIEYPDMRKAMLAGIKPPPPTVVSVARNIDYRVGNYTVEGVHDDLAFSIGTLTGYVEELQSYEPTLLLLKEAMMTVRLLSMKICLCMREICLTNHVCLYFQVWLWRGHFPVAVRGKTYYLPFHSMMAFAWGLLVTWNWERFPSFLVFSIGWALWACNEHVNRHPSRWHNSPSYRDLTRRLLTNTTASETVEPNTNVEEAIAYEKKIESIQKRWRLEKEKNAEHELALQAELGDEMEDAEAAEKVGKGGGIFTGVSANPLKPILFPVQLKLRKVIYAARIAKSILLWNECYYAFWLTNACFLASLVFFFVPFGFIMRWSMRIIALVALGPWNAIIDRVYFRKDPNMSDAERDEEMRLRFKARYQEVLETATNFFVRKESALKMKDMKQFMFGKFLLRVPRFCEDPYEDYPLALSSCAPIDPKTISVPVKERKYGQRLFGDMIPQREIQSVRKQHPSKNPRKTETTPLLENVAEKKYT